MEKHEVGKAARRIINRAAREDFEECLLDSLPGKMRTVLILRLKCEFSFRDVAVILWISEEAAKKRSSPLRIPGRSREVSATRRAAEKILFHRRELGPDLEPSGRRRTYGADEAFEKRLGQGISEGIENVAKVKVNIRLSGEISRELLEHIPDIAVKNGNRLRKTFGKNAIRAPPGTTGPAGKIGFLPVGKTFFRITERSDEASLEFLDLEDLPPRNPGENFGLGPVP